MCTFQPGSFTGWGSEGVKYRNNGRLYETPKNIESLTEAVFFVFSGTHFHSVAVDWITFSFSFFINVSFVR